MENIHNVENLRQELKNLAFIQEKVSGPIAKQSVHDRMLKVAYELQEALSK